jgi:hypothetical protein
MVDKRYLNDDMFVPKSERDTPQQLTQTDEQILKDKTLDYRVLNFASNTFNENETSYYHKSIGGYHAAKLRRYQEMIERYISPEMQQAMKGIVEAEGDMQKVKGDSIFPVLNMLNARYFILPLQDGSTAPLQNPYAMGNAWFADKLTFADNANQEIDAVGKLNLRHEAVADKRFASVLHAVAPTQAADSTRKVVLRSYEPNELKYDVTTGSDALLVFSEIYYPGWTATLDGQPLELGRVNYVLRAAKVPAGKHVVHMEYKPASVGVTETVAYIAIFILLLVFVAAAVLTIRKAKAADDSETETEKEII